MQALLWMKGRDLKLHLFKTMTYTTQHRKHISWEIAVCAVKGLLSHHSE